MGQGEKLMDFRQPDSPGGEGGRKRDMGWSPGREGKEKGQREERRRRAIKTLTSNLVYCVKKSHMHSRPPEGPHCSHVALVDTSSWPRPHSSTGRRGAVQVQRRWRQRRALWPVYWSRCRGGRAGDRPCGRGKNTKMPRFK